MAKAAKAAGVTGPPPAPPAPPNLSTRFAGPTGPVVPGKAAVPSPASKKVELLAMAQDIARIARLVPTHNITDTDVYGKQLSQHATRLTHIAASL